VESVIQQIPEWDNFSVITTGNSSDEPTKLLYSQKMQGIVKFLKDCQSFDLIIYDSPSLLEFVDAKIIASNTNGLVLVMRLGKSDRNSLRQVTDQLKISGVPLLGIVANGVNN
jgi:Mrp family chromosome partitioning ATPase